MVEESEKKKELTINCNKKEMAINKRKIVSYDLEMSTSRNHRRYLHLYISFFTGDRKYDTERRTLKKYAGKQ